MAAERVGIRKGVARSTVFHNNLQCDSIRGVQPEQLTDIPVGQRRLCSVCKSGGRNTYHRKGQKKGAIPSKDAAPKAASSSEIVYLPAPTQGEQKEGHSPYFVFYDTEGMVEITEIAFASLDRRLLISGFLNAVQNGKDASSKARPLKELWTRLDAETEKHACVYLVAHSAKHDEPRVKAALEAEKIVVDKRYQFVDSLHILDGMIAPLDDKFGLDVIAAKVLASEPLDSRPNDPTWIRHTALYDACLLRDVFRILAGHKYLIDTKGASASVNAYRMLLGASDVCIPDAQSQLCKYNIETRTYAQLSTCKARCDNVEDAKLYLVPDGKRLHIETCRSIQGLRTLLATAEQTQSLSRCQKCCFRRA